jgi:hypothetical protein
LQIENLIIGKVESSERGKKNGKESDREINFLKRLFHSTINFSIGEAVINSHSLYHGAKISHPDNLQFVPALVLSLGSVFVSSDTILSRLSGPPSMALRSGTARGSGDGSRRLSSNLSIQRFLFV